MSARKRSRTAPRSQQALRLTGGEWRGRKLVFRPTEGLRPTLSQGRERLFNWLQADIAGRRVLDAFAGSGILGLEALSRGAAEVSFVEQDRTAALMIREHLQTLGAGARGQVHCTDALGWMRAVSAPFDVILLDPPFANDLFQRSIDTLAASGCVGPGSLIYLETPRDFAPAWPAQWATLKETRSGSICQHLCRVANTDSTNGA
ncbi:MAG: 16S rRNA (guanine(966)-N(2))-methyltransferase RsmD [Natronospirillum sp.]|uniref:16S rRNA (guanine(966)-N(2))-methyltransferase RsmD n=1 Tax=Natronospirillum sp. TaxID=2812955 RepID=UPI0025F7967F|nr:16S rRNA (guanine(966)-N(2))-methyltransferase RsmD [Natronospirillum sp.]MCH8551761.1 16S rRNA (guanine(966)-N(2))-methyltransferase RsmD [Natronospirillum sp.]